MESNESENTPTSRPFAGKARSLGLLTAGVLAGGLLAGAGIASAATSGTAATPTASASASTTDTHKGGPGGAAAVRTDEKLATGSTLETLKAAALKAVPGGTIIRVESDAGDGVYEAHMTKADGSVVTVKFDKNLAVAAVEDGMGKGDPAPAGLPAAPAGSTTGA